MIAIPFSQRFQDLMLSRAKSCTTRYIAYGRPGDQFIAFNHKFELDKVERIYLYRVADNLFISEGFLSTHAFVDFWKLLYPKRGYNPNDLVYLHRFHMVER